MNERDREKANEGSVGNTGACLAGTLPRLRTYSLLSPLCITSFDKINNWNLYEVYTKYFYMQKEE